MRRYNRQKPVTMLKVTEKGFTLIEMLIAIAIGAAIMSVMVAAVIVIMRTTSQNDEWNVNLRQVQNAGHWISGDALMAQQVKTNTPGVFLELIWNDWNNDNDVQYFFNGDTLMRTLNGGAPILIAQNIVTDPAHTNCTWDADQQKLTVNIRASLHGNRYAEQRYEITPRPVNRGG
jgi:prepilin-type N-terminal cleavage/methylation domain-containing protein